MTSLQVAMYRGRIGHGIGIAGKTVDDENNSVSELDVLRHRLKKVQQERDRLASENRSLSKQVSKLTHDWLKEKQRKRWNPVKLSCRDIIQTVADFYEISPFVIKSHSHTGIDARPRMVAVYLARRMTTHSLADIGRAMDRDHSTISHAVGNIEKWRKTDAKLDAELVQITDELDRMAML